jgi:Ser/Thr protein kinase RdoA (MazF antagonist)
MSVAGIDPGAALAPWGLSQAALTFVAGRENQVFRVRSPAGDFALRIRRPGYRSDAELLSELQWMAALDQAGLPVPRPLPSRQGRLLEAVGSHRVDLLHWLPGRPLALDDAPAVFRRLGYEMARLHAASDAWARPPGFTRCAWNLEGLLGEAPVWGRFWQNPTLDRPARQRLEAFRDLAVQVLQRQAPALDQGLIHADLVRENVLLDGPRIVLLDFDDGGFGYRLFDLATSLLKNLDEPQYPALQGALLTGYRAVRPIDTALLDLFIALRAATYVGWIVPRLAEPGAAARNRRYIDTALRLCGACLDTAAFSGPGWETA